MGEGLREIAGESARGRVVFFGQQANVVAHGQEAFKQLARLIHPADHGVRIGEPKTTGQKRAFPGRQTVIGLFGPVTLHESVDQKLALDRLNRSDIGRVAWLVDSVLRQEQLARVLGRVAIGLGEGVAVTVEAMGPDVGFDRIT